jgi:hypothetical protein
MKTPSSLLFFALAAVVLSGGCGLFSDTASWTAVLPALPAHWRDTFPGVRADLVVVNADGSTSTGEVSLEAGAWPVRVLKERNGLVLLYPTAGADRLRPASGDDAARTLTLTAAGGFAAERLAHLATLGFDVRAFNSERLLALLAEKGGDPWEFDPVLFETRMVEDKFSVYALKNLPARPVALALPAGAWFSESPLSPLWDTDGSGALVIPELTYGTHMLFRRGGDERVYLQVSERDVLVFGP